MLIDENDDRAVAARLRRAASRQVIRILSFKRICFPPRFLLYVCTFALETENRTLAISNSEPIKVFSSREKKNNKIPAI